MIGGNGGLEAARTILGQPVYIVEDGVSKVDWTKTNYIDWGAFISAVINFLLVALILFIIIKVINNVHKKGIEAKEKLAKKEEKPAEEEKKAE
jgi:large-conductance mechanosensitive channel